MSSSSQVQKMALCLCIPWKRISTRVCLSGVRSRLGILRFLLMVAGQLLRASMSLDPVLSSLHTLTFLSELTVKIVDLEDTNNVLYLRDCPRPTKHLTFSPSGSQIAVSCTDGIVYIYSLSTQEPALLRKIDGVIRRLETDAEATSRAVWHPDGRAFAAATATRDIQVISWSDGERQRVFSGAHLGEITALAWSPNGALLASAAADRKIVLWETKIQKVLAR